VNDKHDGTCPNCGYCKACGRSNRDAAPQVVPMPYPVAVPSVWPAPLPPSPFWQQPYRITCTATSSNINDVSKGWMLWNGGGEVLH
jgi:hypothetical protein